MADRTAPDPTHLLEHAAFVRAVARATLRGDDLVDDVVQETWVAALERGGGRRGPLAPWLAGVARNQARNLLRRRAAHRRREHAASRPEGVSPEQAVVDRLEVERRLIDAVQSLPEHYRTPLVLRYLDDLPPRVIAVRLDLPVATVRTRVRRGLERLRDVLEARYGNDARHWQLALLPVLEPAPWSAPTVAATSGGLLMGKKLLVLAFAIVLLAGGAALIAFPTLRPAGSETAGRGEGLRGADDGAAAGPVLAGRPSTDAPGAGRVPEAVAEADPASSEEASVAVDAVELGDAMRALIADIRRDVAPEWWGVYPTLGTLEGLHGILIARAPADVLDALARYLDARRQGDPSGQEEPPPPDESSLEAMRAALRPLLRGILRREHEIGASLQAWEQGRLADAQSMAEAVLVEEPDNLLATTIRKATAAGVEGTSPGASTARELERTRARYRELERQHTLQDWVMRWPSRGTWKALAAVRKRAKPAFWSALAPDLDEMLDRGGVTIELSDASLYEAVRRIQIETFADVRLARDVEEPQGRLQVVDLQAEARSLRWILDELVGSLPEGWTWVLGRKQVVLTRAGHATASQPETRLRYFDVKDLLAPGTPPSELQVVGGPKTPPVYRPDPAGGPPIRGEDEQAGGRPSR